MAAQLLGDELDEFRVAYGVPVARRVHLGRSRPPFAAHPQQAVDAGQPVGAVDAVDAGQRDGLRDLAQQAVEERRGRVRVGVAACGRGHEVHAIHSFPEVRSGGGDQYVCRHPGS